MAPLQAPKDVNPQTACAFFNLPPEIRNDIYTLVLTVEPMSDGTIALTKRPSNPEIPSVLSLLRTCRTICNEAQGLFYNLHRLKLQAHTRVSSNSGSGPRIRDFIRRLGPARALAIREITLTARFWESFTSALKQMSRLDNLQKLDLEIEDFGPLHGQFHSKELLRETPPLIRALYKLSPSLMEIEVRAIARDGAPPLDPNSAYVVEAQDLDFNLKQALEDRKDPQKAKRKTQSKPNTDP